MSDWSQLSLQEYELNYILKKFNKKESEKNREVLKKWEKAFKASRGGQSTKAYTKEEFYEYIKGKVESSLE